jgi:hypothetical protein
VFALKYTNGKGIQGKFGPRVFFTSVDDRKVWLDEDEASEFEHGLADLGVRPSDFIRVTKIKHPRGGGHSIRVERAETEPRQEAPSRLEAQLEKSIELAPMAREHGPRVFVAQPAPVDGTYRALLTETLKAAIDAYFEAAAYARSKGIAVDLRLDFKGEDLRTSVNSRLMDYWKSGGTR